jgi:GDP-L-fucose synthase
MPTNLYGINDNFDLESSHVIPALMRKFDDARLRQDRSVTIWGSGNPRREFLHVDDLADACVFLMREYNEAAHINVGTGEDLTIRELGELIRDIIYPAATLSFDRSKPDGMPVKRLNVGRLHKLGWRHRIALRDGIAQTYRWFVEQRHSAIPVRADV